MEPMSSRSEKDLTRLHQLLLLRLHLVVGPVLLVAWLVFLLSTGRTGRLDFVPWLVLVGGNAFVAFRIARGDRPAVASDPRSRR